MLYHRLLSLVSGYLDPPLLERQFIGHTDGWCKWVWSGYEHDFYVFLTTNSRLRRYISFHVPEIETFTFIFGQQLREYRFPTIVTKIPFLAFSENGHKK